MQYLVLGLVEGVNIWLFVFVIASAVATTFYTLSYHTYFTLLGDTSVRGKQLGIRQAGTIIAGLLAPISSGIIVSFFGFFAAFVTASICMLIAILPVLIISDISLPKSISFKKALKEVNKTGFALEFPNAFQAQANRFTWALVLFLFVGDYVYFGGILSLAILFEIIGFFIVGNIFDNGGGITLSVSRR
jgi:hypothetical protein